MVDFLEFVRKLFRPATEREIRHGTEGVVCRKNISYGGGDKRLYDMYSPDAALAADVPASLPVIYLHGELFGDAHRKARDEFCKRLASEGLGIINAGFGVCKDGASSASDALDALTDHLVTELAGFAPDGRVIFCADGSGAWLAADFILRAMKDPASFRIHPAGLVAFSGLYDLGYFAQSPAKKGFKAEAVRAFAGLDYAKGFTHEEKEILASYDVTPRLNGDFPPVFVAYTVRDDYYPGQGERMVKALDACGATFREYKAVHASCKHNWQLGQDENLAAAVTASAVRFIRDIASGGAVRGEYTEV